MDALDMIRAARDGYEETRGYPYNAKWVTISNALVDACGGDAKFCTQIESLMVSDIPKFINWMADSYASRYYRGYSRNGLTKDQYTQIAPRMLADFIKFHIKKETAHYA
jgi:hypothetical protein